MIRLVRSFSTGAIPVVLLAGILLFGFGIPVSADTEAVEIQGWIVDEKCGADNAKEEGAQCVLDCHEAGASLVFYDEASERIYQIDDQVLAAKHIGLVKIKARVVGETLQVESIDPVV